MTRPVQRGDAIRLVACGSMALARLVELAYSRRNLDRHADRREGRASRATYPLIVAVHTMVIVGTLLRGARRPSTGWLALLASAQPFRLWVLLLLRDRWNARGSVPSGLRVETRGPYAWVRHPNYAIVIVELFALPMAFRLRALAVLAAVVNGILLAVRIRDEERLLFAESGYRRHFARKPRFVPRII